MAKDLTYDYTCLAKSVLYFFSNKKIELNVSTYVGLQHFIYLFIKIKAAHYMISWPSN
jgi:hypothetical protein